ncbi:carbon-monoxide dehydrogenase, molybdopterin binding, large subunit [freshwater metagenome]|uniref:Carbon-monoxide dehydrogenase, molybdopterin binding, large subunit n=1 Tax=freshwater metagenome TaxID=449393 RepID=A0A094Q0D1_9ZZZZ
MSILGNRVVRKEDPALLTTGGNYVDDITVDGALHVVYVRSMVAHGNITSIDVTEARTAPGVVDVVTNADLTIGDIKPFMLLNQSLTRPVLARERVRYVGEPIVAVVAESRAAAVDAAELVIVDIEPLPVIIDPRDALADDAIHLFPQIATNVAMHSDHNGEPISFANCDVVVTQTTVNQRLAPAPIENRSAIAWWEDGRLVLELGCQGTHPIRNTVSEIYGLEHDQMRVICPDVGGGFGAKAHAAPEAVVLGELSRRTGRPVRWTETRSENMTGMGHGRGQIQTVTLGGTKDGDLLAYRIEILQDAGGYPNMGAILPYATRIMATGVYDIPAVEVSSKSVATNTTPTGAYRGAGRPEASAALERAVDLFADEAGLDPAEVRRRNFVQPDAFPFTTPTGTIYDSGNYEESLNRALDAAGYNELLEEQARRRASGDRRLMGIGIATYVEITGAGVGSEYGSVEVLADGSARVVTGSNPYGQGHITSWSMLVSDQTGIPLDRIEVVYGDTDLVPTGETTGGSRSLQIAGSAVFDATSKLVEIARQRAADLLEANPADIVLDTDTARFHVAGTPAVSLGWEDIGATSSDEANQLFALSDFTASGPTFPFGTHVAVVEIDSDTGKVELRRMIACDDAGVILNPLLVDGQVHGGLAQGISQALFEEVRYDEDGNPLSTTLLDYLMPSAAEFPQFERVELETPSPINPLGAKGIGESGTIGSTPAVQNAVVDAVSHLGIRHIDMPLTPERVWRAINGI